MTRLLRLLKMFNLGRYCALLNLFVMPFPIAAIAPFAPVIASAISGAAGLASQAVANRKNVELMREQNRFSLQSTREMNAWNHPVNELARLRGAGISPGLMYDNGVSGNVQSSPAAPAGTPDIKPLDFSGAMSQVFNNVLAVRAQRLNEENGVAARALQSAQATAAYASAGLSRAEEKRIFSLLDWDISNAKAEYELKQAEIRLNDSKRSLNTMSEQEIISKIGVNAAQVQLIAQQCGLTSAQTSRILYLLEPEKKLMTAQAWNLTCQSKVFQDTIGKIAAEIALLEKQGGQTTSNTIGNYTNMLMKVLGVAGAATAGGLLAGPVGAAAGLAGAGILPTLFGE